MLNVLIWKMFKNFWLFNNDNMQTGYFVCSYFFIFVVFITTNIKNIRNVQNVFMKFNLWIIL